jgi:hypothetical protein
MNLPEDNLNEAKNLLTRFLFKQAEQEAYKSMKIKGLTNQHLDQAIDELNQGSRTKNLKKIRK